MYDGKSIGLAYSWKADNKKNNVTVPFLLCLNMHLWAISKYNLPRLIFGVIN